MSEFDVTLVSCMRLPEPDPDAAPLAEALTAAVTPRSNSPRRGRG